MKDTVKTSQIQTISKMEIPPSVERASGQDEHREHGGLEMATEESGFLGMEEEKREETEKGPKTLRLLLLLILLFP